ncbi:MAG: M20 family metallopeptidase [Planctomycetaceae bacterium]
MNSLTFLKQLIPFPSVSCDSNADVSRWVEQTLQSLGFTTEWLEYTDAEGVTKVCVSGQKGPATGRGLAYFCHTDVVPVSSWSFADSGPWEPLQTDSRLYGRGSCDMKGSLACMLAAAKNTLNDTLTAPLSIVCTADEEIGLRGAAHVVGHSALYRSIVGCQSRAIIGEPTLLNVVHAHKGGRSMKVTSHGIAAHSSTGKGRNANFAMIPFLTAMHQLCQEIDGCSDYLDDRYDPPTINLNLGINDHTEALNITPAQSVCTINFRTMPAVDTDALVQRIQDTAHQCGLTFELMFGGNPVFTDPGSPFIRELLQLTGCQQSQTVPYGTDGSCFTELSDIAVLGPGDIRQAHTDDEWISLEQMEQGTALYTRLIRQWCVDGKN